MLERSGAPIALLMPLLWLGSLNRAVHSGRSPMGIRTDRRPWRSSRNIAALFGLALMASFAPSPVAAQSYTPEQRAACEGDAMRLCGQFGADVERITACMRAKRSQLSPGCRKYFVKRRPR
jgi:hypothetical protein